MIKEIKINSTPDKDIQSNSRELVVNDVVSMISSLDKCCGQYCIVIDVVESNLYASYKLKVKQINTLLERLTRRESEVLHLVIKGMPNKAISSTLNISIETVKSHRKKIISKVGLQKVSDLVNILFDIFISKTLHSEVINTDPHIGTIQLFRP